jgi:hypothetical protein
MVEPEPAGLHTGMGRCLTRSSTTGMSRRLAPATRLRALFIKAVSDMLQLNRGPGMFAVSGAFRME